MSFASSRLKREMYVVPYFPQFERTGNGLGKLFAK
jgi:hypothetical protein